MLEAEIVEAEEVAIRAAHASVRNKHAAVRVRPPRVLADRVDPVPLRHLLGVVVEEAGEVAGVAEGMARLEEPLRGLLARLAVEIGLDPAQHLPDTRPLERETLLGDIAVDVAEILPSDGPLDDLREADRLIVGDAADRHFGREFRHLALPVEERVHGADLVFGELRIVQRHRNVAEKSPTREEPSLHLGLRPLGFAQEFQNSGRLIKGRRYTAHGVPPLAFQEVRSGHWVPSMPTDPDGRGFSRPRDIPGQQNIISYLGEKVNPLPVYCSSEGFCPSREPFYLEPLLDSASLRSKNNF